MEIFGRWLILIRYGFDFNKLNWGYFTDKIKRVMIQLQTLIQTYLVQTDVTLIHWLN